MNIEDCKISGNEIIIAEFKGVFGWRIKEEN